MSKDTGNFAELLKAITDTGEEADTLTKSAPVVEGKDGESSDDKTIQSASTASTDDDDKTKDKDGAPVMTKAMTVTGPDGKELEAIDATEIIKALQDKVGEHDTVLAKALTGLTSTIQKQGALIKSLQENVAKLSGQGAGRKAVIVAVEKPGVGGDLTKSQGAEDGKLTVDEFFAKAEAAYGAEKISGAELRSIDVARRYGSPIDPALIRKVALAS